jgi:hypothetical protein
MDRVTDKYIGVWYGDEEGKTHQRLSLKTTIVGREAKMTHGEDNEVLAEKDNVIEQMRVNGNKVKINRVMEFCVLFTKVQLGEELTHVISTSN